MALLRLTVVSMAASLCMASTAAFAGPAGTSTTTSTESSSPSDTGSTGSGKGEHLTVKGRRSLPPGYQDAPSDEITRGADPDHAAEVHRDAVTGSDLSRFGTSYQDSGPYGSGQLGDATGNGWVTPR